MKTNQPETDQWLHHWTSIDDVNRFFDYVEHQRQSGFDVELNLDYHLVENTVKVNDPWNTLCIFTNAFYSVDINKLKSLISTALTKIIEELSGLIFPSLFIDQDLWNNPGSYDIRWAWLLFCSQTEKYEGMVLNSSYEIYPICIAKELLEKQKNRLAVAAQKMLEKIETLVD